MDVHFIHCAIGWDSGDRGWLIHHPAFLLERKTKQKTKFVFLTIIHDNIKLGCIICLKLLLPLILKINNNKTHFFLF